ncbi:hypothetical protein ACJX0J_033166, partial [Zea mays]
LSSFSNQFCLDPIMFNLLAGMATLSPILHLGSAILLAHLFSFDSATTSKRYNEAIHLKVEMRFKEKVGQGGFGTTSSMNFNPKISDFGLAKLHNGFRHAGVRDGEWKEEFRPRIYTILVMLSNRLHSIWIIPLYQTHELCSTLLSHFFLL